MTADSPDLVIAKRLLDHAKHHGFEFLRIAGGPDGALLGTRRTGDRTDIIHLNGVSQDCCALRKRNSTLIIPGSTLVEHRTTGDALNVLNTVLTWDTA